MLPEEKRRAEARVWFRRGMRSLETNELAEGIDALKRAYCILPHPKVLFNIGYAYAEWRKYDEAIAWLRQYLESGPPDGFEVELLIERLERQRCVEAKKSLLAINRPNYLAAACKGTVLPWPPPELK